MNARLHGGGEPPTISPMEPRIAALETKWDAIFPTLATKTDIADMRADMHKMDASIKTWMIGTIVAMMIGFGGLFLNMTTSLRQQPPAQAFPAAAPTIIYMPAPALPVAPPAK